jgi:hypothetical protein
MVQLGHGISYKQGQRTKGMAYIWNIPGDAKTNGVATNTISKFPSLSDWKVIPPVRCKAIKMP